MIRAASPWRGPKWARALLMIAGVALLAVLGYFASAGSAGPLGPADTTTTTSSTTDSSSTGSTSTDTSTTTNTTSTTTSTATTTAPSTSTTTTTTSTAPAGPEGQIKLASGKTSIPISSVALPARLIVDGVRFSPSLVASRGQPLAIRVHVSDTRGYVVRGALVFVRSTPLVTSTPLEQTTDQAGYVTLTALPKQTFPLKRGYHVQFFIRARKEGESLLAGVSSRRLAQVATTR
jgi:protocatechuate 3,4-dioxygenase beta subunit